jgi:hypothetical protein
MPTGAIGYTGQTPLMTPRMDNDLLYLGTEAAHARTRCHA